MGFFDKNSLFCCTWQPLIRTCILGIKKGDFRKKIFLNIALLIWDILALEVFL